MTSLATCNGLGSGRPDASRAIRKATAATVTSSAAWPNPKLSSPVTASWGRRASPYQGKSMLTATASTPAPAIRSAGVSGRRRGSVEGLSATVAGFELVPVIDLVLIELPAEIDLVVVDDRGEVDQA